jgi:hypothetical protein
MPKYTKEDITIRTIAENTMELDQMGDKAKSKIVDSIANKFLSFDTVEANAGDGTPMIVLNNYFINKYVTSFRLELNGFLPVLRVSFIAYDSSFLSVAYPKDGDVISVYIRSDVVGIYKPIRMDFNVLNVSSELTSKLSSNGSDPFGQGSNLRFNILAECRIPGVYTNRSRSFGALNSLDTLLEVSQELKLGFATNESNTTDEMTWICPNYSYYDFINDVNENAYKDGESFYHVFVDCYYNLNFVNLGNQFGYLENPLDKIMFTPGSLISKAETFLPTKSAADPVEIPLVISNKFNGGTYPTYINGYILISNSGQKSNMTGYFTDISFYDENAQAENPLDKVISYEIESGTPESLPENSLLQKGRSTENLYRDERRVEWLGILNEYGQGNPGVHANYLHARYQNIMNYEDSTKMTFRVELANYYPGIYRGQVLPVEIYVFKADDNRKANSGSLENGESPADSEFILDYFLSGNYVVMGMDVTWEPGRGMKQVLNLCKRVWQINTSGPMPKYSPFKIADVIRDVVSNL